MTSTHRLRATLALLMTASAAACATRGRAAARPALGRGTESVVAAPGGPVGLCEPRDRSGRICGWAPTAQAERWLRAVERLMREPASLAVRSSPELKLSDDVAAHVARNAAGSPQPYQLVFTDGRRSLTRSAPLTADGALDFLVRLREAVARARGR